MTGCACSIGFDPDWCAPEPGFRFCLEAADAIIAGVRLRNRFRNVVGLVRPRRSAATDLPVRRPPQTPEEIEQRKHEWVEENPAPPGPGWTAYESED